MAIKAGLAKFTALPFQTIECADDIFFVSFDMVLSGKHATGFYERDADRMGAANTLADLASGEFDNPDRVYRANPAHGTFRDVSEDFARELLSKALADRAPNDLPSYVETFCERHMGCRDYADALREAGFKPERDPDEWLERMREPA